MSLGHSGIWYSLPCPKDLEGVILEDSVDLCGIHFDVLHTPGHTPGSVCLLWKDQMFSGDTLFQGSCGRVDFPGSSPRDMMASLRRLASLEADYQVHPGHGGSTTLSEEKRYNPYLR